MSYKEELIMILKNQIITNIKIESVNDLYKLKPFLEDGILKINKSQIARELEVDRRTVDKYITGYSKPETRNYNDCITPYYNILAELLSDRNQQVFIATFVITSENILNSIPISKKAGLSTMIRSPFDMKHLWVNRPS